MRAVGQGNFACSSLALSSRPLEAGGGIGKHAIAPFVRWLSLKSVSSGHKACQEKEAVWNLEEFYTPRLGHLILGAQLATRAAVFGCSDSARRFLDDLTSVRDPSSVHHHVQ